MSLLKKTHGWCNKHEWVILLIGIVILARIPTLFTPHYYGDEEIYFVMGRAWWTGVPMYEEMFDHKPPLLYILAGIAHNVFWFRTLLMGAMIVHTLLFHRLATLFWTPLRPKLAYLSSLIFVLLTTLPTFEGNIANAELFMMLPLTISLLMVWKTKTNDWRRFGIAGIIAGVGWLFKIPVAFDFAAIALFLFAFREKTFLGSLKRVFSLTFFSYVIGFVLPLISSFAYYQLKGHGASYLDTVLTMNLGYVSSWSTSAYEFNPFKSGLMVRGMIVGSFTLLLYIFRSKLNPRFILAALWFAFSFFGSLLSGRPYPHYLHEPFVPLSLLLPFIFVLDTVVGWLFMSLLVVWGVWTARQIGFWGYPTKPLYENFWHVVSGKISKQEYVETFDGARRNYAIGNYLNERLTARDSLYVWGSDATIYNITNTIPAGGKYIVDFHVHDLKKFDYVMAQLARTTPKFIVTLPNAKDFPDLYTLLQEEYIEVMSADGATVYMRSPL